MYGILQDVMAWERISSKSLHNLAGALGKGRPRGQAGPRPGMDVLGGEKSLALDVSRTTIHQVVQPE